MKPQSKLTSKYQITIPSEVRKQLHLKPGDPVYFDVARGQAILRPTPTSYTNYYRGMGKGLWDDEGGGAAFVKKLRAGWSKRKLD